MKALSGDELVAINQQAVTAATAVLSEPVLAATLCQSRIPFEKKVDHRSRWFGRGVTEQQANDNRITSTEVWLASGGLPDSFILAVTAGSIYVIEDKRENAQLFAGQVLKSWVRSGFRASVDRRPFSPVPADCQSLRLCLPIEPVKNRAMNRALKQAAEMAAARGLPGAEHAFVVGRDAPTEGVIDALIPSSPGAGPMVAAGAGGGHIPGVVELLASGQRVPGVLMSFSASGHSTDSSFSIPELRDSPFYVLTVELHIPNLAPMTARNSQPVPPAVVPKLALGLQLTCAVDQANPAKLFAVDWAAAG
jgi:hypothetical protein